MSNISGAGGNTVIAVAAGDNLTVDSFGAFGTGATASQPAELDTLKFTSAGMTAASLMLTQSGSNVIITFEGVANTQVTLTNVTIDQLENIAGQGNFMFAGQASVTESVDIFSAPALATVQHNNTTTFLSQAVDQLNGNDGSNDIIHGLGGNDGLAGLGGNDRLYGEAGNDHLDGGDGNDTLLGGDGNDTLVGGAGSDVLDGGTGADALQGGTGNDTYYVDNSKDVITEVANASSGGIDTVISTISYTLGADLENLTLAGSSNLTGNGNALNNVILGNGGNNTLNGADGNDTLDGGAGNDVLDGGVGTDKMSGGTGNDVYHVDDLGDKATETISNLDGGGIDTVISSVSFTLSSNLDNLTLTGSDSINGIGNELANVLNGNAGNNTLDGGIGADKMAGGAGNDVYRVDNAGDIVTETITNLNGGGIDTVISSVTFKLGANLDNLTLTGTDNINGTGNGLDNVLNGNAGNNTLEGGTGADTMSGGAGNDVYRVDNVGDKVTESLSNANGGGIDTVISTVSFTLGANLDNLALSGSGNVDGKGNNLDNVITGNSGDNVLGGGGGNDTINGGVGNDQIDGGTGADTMQGGAGNDTYAVDDAGDKVTEASSAGIDTVLSSITYTLGANLENLTLTGTGAIDGTGNTLANTIVGNSGANVLSGGDGNDTITGGKGDTLNGDGGNDVLLVQAAGFTKADGGTGVDSVNLEKVGSAIDLTGALGATLKNVEVIDIGGSVNNTLTLDAKSVAAMSGGAAGANTLIIRDDASDTIKLDSSWKHTGTQTNPSGQPGSYDIYTSGGSTLLIEHHGVPVPVPTLSGLDGTNGFRIDGNIADGQSSFSVHSAGDVNGDGVDDIIVGSRDANGDAYVIYGHAGAFGASIDLGSLDGKNGFHITNVGHSTTISASAPYGVAVSGAGDVNGDGIADFIVSAYDASPDTMHTGAGSSYLIYGKAGGFPTTLDLEQLTAADGVRINGIATGDQFGTSVAAAGDVNGDGYDDIIIGADVASKALAGSAYVLFGHAGAFTSDLSSLDGSNGFRIDGPTADGFLGRSVSSAGDINGDGFADLIVGAPHFHEDGQPDGAGTAYVILGHPGNFNAVTKVDNLGSYEGFSITGTASNDQVGFTVAAAGDINGDGLDDLIVGSSARSSSAAYGAGAAYVLYGQTGGFGPVDLSSLSASQGFTIHGAHIGDYAGTSVSSAGDVNGDGYADLLIGAANAGASHDTGAAYLVYGHAGGFGDVDLSKLDGTNGFALEGLAAGDYTGFPVSAAGDVNGDGYADLIVGAYTADPSGHTDAGSSYVVFGGNFTGAVTHLGTNAGETLTGNAQAESFVAGGGDDTVNGGGGKDVIYGGAGNDEIHVTDGTFAHVDGGGGSDTLHLDYAGAIDLDNLDGDGGTVDRDKVDGVETISMDNGLANAMTLRAVDVLELNPENQNVGGKASLDDVLKIDGNSGDTLHLSAFEGWSAADTTTLPGYAVYTTHDIQVAVETTIAVTVN